MCSTVFIFKRLRYTVDIDLDENLYQHKTDIDPDYNGLCSLFAGPMNS